MSPAATTCALPIADMSWSLGPDGLAAVRRLRVAQREAPIVLVGIFPRGAEAQPREPVAYPLMPFAPVELQAALRAAVGHAVG